MATVAYPSPSVKGDRVAGWLTPDEFAVLEVICDTLLPSLEPPDGSSEAVAAYYRRCAQDLHVAQQIAEKLGEQSQEVQAAMHLFLKLFTAPPMSLLLAGSFRSFISLPLARRERFLLSLANSPIGPFRQGYQGLKRLAGLIYFSALNEQGVNPNWAVLDYTPPEPQPASRNRKPAPINPLSISEDILLEADAVVIGSGAGGGVVAGELAMAGKSVIVLEKGGYNHEGNFTLREAQAMPELFLKKGTLATQDLGLVMMAGSTLGGGTVVNWMTSFRTPDDVLIEWDQISGLKGCFTDSSLQHSFAAVEQRISVNSEQSQHNRQNQILFEGAAALGYHAGIVRRNATGCEQRCGACNLGCCYGCSQSTLKTYLQDAHDHGARIIVHGSAEKVLIKNGRAVGVEARVHDAQTGSIHNVIIHAKVVVVAAGAVHSPVLLLRSGIENPHAGRHLHLHPTAISVGVFPEKVYAWQGVLQSAYSDQFTHLDDSSGYKYGYKLEVPPTHPGLFGLATPWYSARNYREEMTRIAHLASLLVLTRDKGEGAVTVDRAGEPLIKYVVSAYDRRHILHGLCQSTRIHLAAGAERVISLQSKLTDLRCSPDETIQRQRLRAFDQQIKRHGLEANRILMFSAHQMGTCRIGAHSTTSVTNEHQQVHGVKGLFVCDSSVFPTACGVNPMLSIMALAHKASQYIKTEIR